MNDISFTNGCPRESYLYRGLEYPLRLAERAFPALALEDGAFVLSSSTVDRYTAFETWYRRALYDDLHSILPGWTKRIGVSPKVLRIKTVRTLWGSCSSSGSITMCTRLALVPPDLLEYVVVHELCHLKHMNHSPIFWAEVAKYLPDHKERRTLLKKNSQNYIWW